MPPSFQDKASALANADARRASAELASIVDRQASSRGTVLLNEPAASARAIGIAPAPVCICRIKKRLEGQTGGNSDNRHEKSVGAL
jgi:hypothetical protein